jgi:hypothetical protein
MADCFMLSARNCRLVIAGLGTMLLAQPFVAGAETSREDRWWGHVKAIAGDDKEGRLTGSQASIARPIT